MKSVCRPPASPASMLGCWLVLAALANATEPPAADTANTKVPDTTMVIVEGVGLDVETARKDAYRAAVRQVLGTLVDSETLVENDQLVTDKVVVFSDGFVEKVEDLPNGLSKDGGLVRLRVKAFVKSGQIKDNLLRANANAPPGRVIEIEDADSLLAQVITSQERKIGARDLFLAAAEEFPASCFQAEAFPLTPASVRSDGDEVVCDVRIRITARQKEYDDFAKRLIAFLEKIPAAAQGEFAIPILGTIDASPPVEAFFGASEISERFQRSITRAGDSPLFSLGLTTDLRQGVPWDAVNTPSAALVAGRAGLLNERKKGFGVVLVPQIEQPSVGRWFYIAHQDAAWARALAERVMTCSIVASNEQLKVGQSTTAARFLGVLYAIGDNQRGYLGMNKESWNPHLLRWACIAPGHIQRYATRINPIRNDILLRFGPSLEFTVPVAVPVAAFTKGLRLECTLTNGPPEPKAP